MRRAVSALARIRGRCDLVHRDGLFFLHRTVEFEEPPPAEVRDCLGVDMGIVRLATDSDGGTHTGERVGRVRGRYHNTRGGLQRLGTKSARRILKRIRRRESRLRLQESSARAWSRPPKALRAGSPPRR
jgi:transposase